MLSTIQDQHLTGWSSVCVKTFIILIHICNMVLLARKFTLQGFHPRVLLKSLVSWVKMLVRVLLVNCDSVKVWSQTDLFCWVLLVVKFFNCEWNRCLLSTNSLLQIFSNAVLFFSWWNLPPAAWQHLLLTTEMLQKLRWSLIYINIAYMLVVYMYKGLNCLL